jgi:hypothetical protein
MYMIFRFLVCVSLVRGGGFCMIVGSLLKKQWATDGKKDFVIHLPFIFFAM